MIRGLVIFIAASVGSNVFLLTPRASNAQQETPSFKGVQSCERCHIRPLDTDNTDFVLLTESKIWREQDKHALAYELIDPNKSPLAAQMCRLLKITDISQARQCLSCHANWLKSEPNRPPTFERGVTCESCHGPSSEWLEPHWHDDWRAKSADEKAALGEVEVRNTARRAEQCFSCHIGNVAEGKIVTHEMYAAGHPPLPGIEVETFAAEMPAHWRYLSEKPDFKFRKEFVEANCKHLTETAGKEQHRAKSVIVGSAVAMRESIELLADLAADTRGWPELSAFHCASCHHDLKAPPEAGPRYFGSAKVGRPPMHLWPTALLRIALLHSANYKQDDFATYNNSFTAAYNRLREAVASRPFGDPAEIAEAATQLSGGLDKLINRLQTATYTPEQSEKALAALLEFASEEETDYHSARQLAWAARVLRTELKAPYPTNDEALTSWQKDIRDPAIAEVKSEFANLDALLYLDLPASQADNIRAAQQPFLKAAADFSYDEFRNQMRNLAEKALGR